MWQVPSMAYFFSTFHTVFGTPKEAPLLEVPEISVQVSTLGKHPPEPVLSFPPGFGALEPRGDACPASAAVLCQVARLTVRL